LVYRSEALQEGVRIPLQSTPNTENFVDPGPDGSLNTVWPADSERPSDSVAQQDNQSVVSDTPGTDAEQADVAAADPKADQPAGGADFWEASPRPDLPSHADSKLDGGYELADGHNG
jgi:hypothetical protein